MAKVMGHATKRYLSPCRAAASLPPLTTHTLAAVAELRRALARSAQQHEQGGGGGEQPRISAKLQHRLPFRSEPYTLTLHLPPPTPGVADLPQPLMPRRSHTGAAAAAEASNGGMAGACGPPLAAALDLADAPHRLQHWFGLRAFLLLSPDSYSGRVLEAEVRVVGAHAWPCVGCGSHAATRLQAPHASARPPACPRPRRRTRCCPRQRWPSATPASAGLCCCRCTTQ